jgi:predicted ATP-grasp superfamily ATP-dependent carboligase
MTAFDQIVAVGPHDPDFARNHPEVMLPMFQTYYPVTIERVYSLSGFRDRSGARTAALAAVKVMQRPRCLGIGLCFEEAPVDEALAAKVFSLCERIGYYGAFEAEFIQSDDQSLLIDFNARFYNQMGLDIARGLDLPGLVYASATRQEDKVDEILSNFRKRETGLRYAFCNGIQFALVARARRRLGSMSDDEADRWRQWLTHSERTLVDTAFDADDRWPHIIDAASQIFLSVRYFRAFLRDCRE